MTDHITTLNIVPINKTHIRENFSCTRPELDQYLQKHARQNDEKNISKTFVAVNQKNIVPGYYTLSAASIEFDDLPKTIARTLPHCPIPAATIGKFAVDETVSGQGLGEKLLIDALQRIVFTNNEVTVKLVLVDALDEDAKNYWHKYGFLELPDNPLKLFLPIETIQSLFQ